MAIPPMAQVGCNVGNDVDDNVGFITKSNTLIAGTRNDPDLSAIREVIDIAKSIRETIGIASPTPNVAAPETPFILAKDFLHFPPAASIKPLLVDLGLPYDTMEKLSEIYIRQVEALKISSERIARATCLQLASLPQVNGTMPLETLQRRVCEAHCQRYSATLDKLSQEAIALARNHLTLRHDTLAQASAPELVKNSPKKSKRHFKTEYLPLFEFAFEKDRFPSREDKKHLARISGMSFRQVSVWFQNRRCRQASRAKSHRVTPAPKTFEEMKERLGVSAREALAKPLPLTKLNPDPTERVASEEPVLVQDSSRCSVVPEIIVLDNATSPELSTRAVSLEATEDATSPWSSGRAVSLEATDDGFASDERDDLADDFLGTPVYQLPTVVEEPAPVPHSQNPLNPFNTSVHAFPAVYAPSQLTFDPFVVEHYEWLRDPRANPRNFIDPTPDAVEDMLSGFDRMDVDEPSAKIAGGQLSRPSGRRNVSSGSNGIWSSSESTIGSCASSYSSSARSSPRYADAELPTSSESALEADLDAPSACTLEIPDYASSPVGGDTRSPEPEAETEAEPACDSPGDDSTTATSLKNEATPTWESLAKADVDACALPSPTLQHEQQPLTVKWENLLAAASVVS